MNIYYYLLVFAILFIPSTSWGDTYMLKLSTLEKYNESRMSYYNPVKKYGEVITLSSGNGVVRVYLQHFQSRPFQTRDEANRVLTAIKKDPKCKRFKKAYIETNTFGAGQSFKSAKLNTKDDEIIISIKLNGNRLDSMGQGIQSPQQYSTNTKKNYFHIQVGSYDRKKKKGDIMDVFKLERREILVSRPDKKNKNSIIWFFGNFSDCKSANERLEKLPNLKGEDPFIIKEVRVGNKSEYSKVTKEGCI